MKQIVINIFKFYIFINIHVALSIVSLYLIFNPTFDINYLFFIFFSTISGYNFIRFFNFKGNRFFIKKFIVKFIFFIQLLLSISTIISFYLYFKLNTITKLLLIPFFIISFFYNYNYKYAPFLKLRNNGIVKIISVAFVWSGLIILIPTFQQNLEFKDYILHFLWVFFYILMLTLSFDQRDLYIDDTNLNTIPQLFHKRLSFIYFLLYSILTLISYFIFNDKKLFISLIFISLSIILAYRSNEHKSFYYTAFWIEALPIFWLISLNILKN